MSSPITIEVIEHFPLIVPEHYDFNTDKIIPEMIHPNKGNFRAYWVEMQMDLLGCLYIFKSPTATHVMLPSLSGYDKDAKRYVSFPCISFADNQKNVALFEALKAAFLDYARKKFMAFDPKRVARSERFVKKKASCLPNKPAQIRSTGNFSKYKDWKDVKSKIH